MSDEPVHDEKADLSGMLAQMNLEVVYVATATLHPNPWNPNFESPRVYESVRESIRLFGFIDPIAVRKHPTIEGEWEILGGEHRWRIAVEDGIEQVPITDLSKNKTISDIDAKKLVLSLNTGGEPDLVPLAKLLADMAKELDLGDLQIGLPYDLGQLDELLKLGNVDWDGFDSEAAGTIQQHLKQQRATAHYAVLEFGKDQRQKFDTFVDLLKGEIEGAEISTEDAVLYGLAAACKQR